jgi:hypothetical protein
MIPAVAIVVAAIETASSAMGATAGAAGIAKTQLFKKRNLKDIKC